MRIPITLILVASIFGLNASPAKKVKDNKKTEATVSTAASQTIQATASTSENSIIEGASAAGDSPTGFSSSESFAVEAAQDESVSIGAAAPELASSNASSPNYPEPTIEEAMAVTFSSSSSTWSSCVLDTLPYM